MMSLNALIIGLGQVAWSFDEEPNRKDVWSHLSAYKLNGAYSKITAYDLDSNARIHFSKRHPDVELLTTLDSIANRKFDVVSICTPNNTHRIVLEQLLDRCTPRAIWCEKPLATDLSDGEWMVDACRHRGIPMWVSHGRRWNPLWMSFRDRILSGDIGTLRSLRIAMPNRIWSIGSHTIDLLQWIGGSVANIQSLDMPTLMQSGEPARTALFGFVTGAVGIMQVTGLKEKLIVEGEAIGDEGRLIIDEIRREIRFERFAPSSRFEAYEELSLVDIINLPNTISPFVSIVQEITSYLNGDQEKLITCSGQDALYTQRLLSMIA